MPRYLLSLLLISAAILAWPGQATAQTKAASKDSEKPMLIEKDYEALTGRWQLVKSIVDGKPVPEAEVKQTVLITDHNEFRFPADARVGTAPLGKFTIDPTGHSEARRLDGALRP